MLLTITGLGLGAMYFLIASGLSLIYGLMGVLNFAHGALLTVGAYMTWWMSTHIGGGLGTQLLVGAVFGIVVGALLAALIELVLIRPLYRRPVEQVLVTVGLALVLGALVEAIWGFDAQQELRNTYVRTGTVREPGEYAVRGGIIDLWPPGTDEPLRLDLFGRELETIRSFDAGSQLSSGTRTSIELLPASETSFDPVSIRTPPLW